ncbi:MAG: dihydroorotate dehydrogenase electron transfer subunit [Pirellulales bacterium]
MTPPLSAKYYADSACYEHVRVVDQVRIARDTYRVRVHAPRIARRIVPGQFVMLRLTDCNDPLLGRPLALYDTVLDEHGEPVGLDIVYIVLGKMTSRLAALAAGAPLEMWGPLGNGFEPRECAHLLLAAGGIGQTPFLALAQEVFGKRRYGDPPRHRKRIPRVTLCYGVRTAELLAGVADFEALGVEVRISSDDGTAGHHGLVTDLIGDVLRESTGCHTICCGPEPMMAATAALCREAGESCDVSLETPMACGVGICFSCVAKIRQEDGHWDYKRTCVDGPVFDAESILW